MTNPTYETIERVSALTDELAISDIGIELAQRPRYGVFKPDNMSVQEWEYLLDSDVNNFRHNALTAALGYIICVNEGASPEVTAKVVLTCGIHDIPEIESGSASGDIPLGLATPEDTAGEHTFLMRLGRDPRCAITPEEASVAEAVMLDSKDQRATEEGELFWLTEKLGYFRSAFIAFDTRRQLAEIAEERELRGNLVWMWSDIFGNSYTDLAFEFDKYKSIRDVFSERYSDLEEMYALTLDNLTDLKDLYAKANVSGRQYDYVNEVTKIVNGFGAHIYMVDLIKASSN